MLCNTVLQRLFQNTTATSNDRHQWSWRLELPDNRAFVQQFLQTDNKDTPKVRTTVPLWGESIGPVTYGFRAERDSTRKVFLFDDVIMYSHEVWWPFADGNSQNFEWNYKLLHWISLPPGGSFKNAYELLNLRALKFSSVYKIHIFQCMGEIFCVKYQRVHLKFHTKYQCMGEIFCVKYQRVHLKFHTKYQCMGEIFWVKFQRVPLKFHTHALKDAIFIQGWSFKSSGICEFLTAFEPTPIPVITLL